MQMEYKTQLAKKRYCNLIRSSSISLMLLRLILTSIADAEPQKPAEVIWHMCTVNMLLCDASDSAYL